VSETRAPWCCHPIPPPCAAQLLRGSGAIRHALLLSLGPAGGRRSSSERPGVEAVCKSMWVVSGSFEASPPPRVSPLTRQLSRPSCGIISGDPEGFETSGPGRRPAGPITHPAQRIGWDAQIGRASKRPGIGAYRETPFCPSKQGDRPGPVFAAPAAR
jgi:hypothetical protein